MNVLLRGAKSWQLARAGWQGDAFGLVNREDPAWTRERWDRATAALAHTEAA